jgi:hypothetical protein
MNMKTNINNFTHNYVLNGVSIILLRTKFKVGLEYPTDHKRIIEKM